jgi:hypothetical protein
MREEGIETHLKSSLPKGFLQSGGTKREIHPPLPYNPLRTGDAGFFR